MALISAMARFTCCISRLTRSSRAFLAISFFSSASTSRLERSAEDAVTPVPEVFGRVVPPGVLSRDEEVPEVLGRVEPPTVDAPPTPEPTPAMGWKLTGPPCPRGADIASLKRTP